jgi:integrase
MFLFKRSNGFYYLYFTDTLTGKRISKTTKCRIKSQALNYLKTYQTENKTPVTQTVYYLDTLQAEVLKYVSNNFTIGTYDIYKTTFKYLRDILGNKPIKHYTSKDIEKYKETRIKTVEKTTCNIEIRTIKAIFNLALKWNWINTNPLKDIKQFPIPEKQRIAFNNSEINIILGEIKDLWLKNIVEFALLTACRISEILNIQLKDINLNEHIITIRNKDDFKTKSGKNRIIPVSDKLLKLLQTLLMHKGNILTYYNPEHYLFNKNGIKYNKDYVSGHFKKYLRKAKLNEKFCFHSLRHTAITNLIKAGVNINYVKQIAGHSSINTTMNYIHILTEDLREAVNKIDIG